MWIVTFINLMHRRAKMADIKYDVAVVGAGVIGLCTAYHLVNNGIKTVLFEQFPVPHSRGSSHGHSRIIRHAYKESFYCRMMPEAYRMWQELEQKCGQSLLIQNGVLEIGNKDCPELAAIEKNLQKVGVPHERMNCAEMHKRYPMINKESSCEGVIDKTGGFLLANKCLNALLQSIVGKGGLVREMVEVLKIEPQCEGGVVLTTSDGKYQAMKVVITAGSWNKSILAGLHCNLPLQPVKTRTMYWRETQLSAHKPDKMPVFIDITDHGIFYGFPSFEYPGLVKAGLCFHHGPPADPETRDRADDTAILKAASDYISANLPSLDSSEPCIMESCLYTITPDGHFIIDKHPTCDRIIIGAGMSGHGFKLAMVVGEILADMAQEKELKFDIQPFRMDRFSEENKRAL